MRRSESVLVAPAGNAELGDWIDGGGAARPWLDRLAFEPLPALGRPRCADQVLLPTAQAGRGMTCSTSGPESSRPAVSFMLVTSTKGRYEHDHLRQRGRGAGICQAWRLSLVTS
jgi:hypothetical protein